MSGERWGSDAIKVPSIALCSPYSRLAPPCCPFSFCFPRPTFGLSCHATLSWLSFEAVVTVTGSLCSCVLSSRSNACCFLSFCPQNHRSFQVDVSNSVQWSKKCLSRDDGLRFEPFLRAAALDGRERKRERRWRPMPLRMSGNSQDSSTWGEFKRELRGGTSTVALVSGGASNRWC